MGIYQIANRAFEHNNNILMMRALALKDFERLYKLLQFDFPEAEVIFDYSNLETALSVTVQIDANNESKILEYFKSNYYEITPIGGANDPLLKTNALSILLKPNMVFSHQGHLCTFDRFGTKYRGYIDETPGRPGLHHDFEKIIYKHSGEDKEMEMAAKDFSWKENPSLFEDMLKLGGNWKHEMFENRSFIGSLPPTAFYEGDIVKISSQFHPKYNEFVPDQQYAVYRINWNSDPLIYRIKLNKDVIFDATADQLAPVENGVTRLYYAGCAPKYWKDLQTEAEFYLLLGLFEYHYNANNDSYCWSIAEAKQAISEQKGDAILKWKDQLFMISFITGEDVSFDSQIVADATLNDDLVLTL